MGIEVRYFRDELTFLLFFNPLHSLRHLSLLAMSFPIDSGIPSARRLETWIRADVLARISRAFLQN